ncbi:MAG: glycerophosphodiester phosphodiesterase family protein [SAR324 cluster bacterium]|nr:glycerophosphodiester phosphodiesterase family protein [SAR324 cluster bacterium]
MEVIVHRGANKVAPENTQASAEACIALGMDFVEIDVRLSKDEIPFILHDRSVDRTTNGTGLINELRSDQIDQLDAGSWFDQKFAKQTVPRLEKYLFWIRGKSKVFLDMKDKLLHGKNLQTVVDLVYKTKMEKDCFFGFQDSTKDSSRAKELSEIAPELILKINADTQEEVRKAKSHYNANIVETSNQNFNRDYQNICRDLNLKSMIYEANWNEDLIKQTLRSGADLINLDDPHLFLKIRNEFAG